MSLLLNARIRLVFCRFPRLPCFFFLNFLARFGGEDFGEGVFAVALFELHLHPAVFRLLDGFKAGNDEEGGGED